MRGSWWENPSPGRSKASSRKNKRKGRKRSRPYTQRFCSVSIVSGLMKKRKFSKAARRKGAIAFCVTCLLLTLLTCSSAAVYNTASVLYGEEQVASVAKNGTSYEFILFSEKRTISAPKAEETAEWILGYTPWVPDGFRALLLAAGGIWQGAQKTAEFLMNR